METTALARNGSGIYSLPGTYQAVSGETIQAQQHNDPLEDLQSDANAARPIVAGGTGAQSAAGARTSLGVPGLASDNTFSGTNTFSGNTVGIIPIGSGMDFWGSTAPAGWLFPYGQAISRTTYAALFAAIGTTYGTGDGSTTFNLPDKRGRTSFAKDDMGGTASGLLTSSTVNPNGTTLGAFGGAQTVTLLTANLPPYTPAGVVNPNTNVASWTGNTIDGGTASANQAPNAAFMSRTNATFTGAPQGGTSTPVNKLPPGIVCNYIIFAGV